jgi:hypothetical protein
MTQLHDASPRGRLAQLLAAPDRDALVALLHERARFHSPVADYEGRADVAQLLSIIPTIVTGVDVCRQLVGDREVTSFLTGRVAAERVEAVVDERYDESGALIVVTLMLRPLSALRTAVGLMGLALDASPRSQQAVIG